MKIILLLLIPASVLGQINGPSDDTPTEPISGRVNLDQLDKWRNVWKALCDRWCPPLTYMTFPHLLRLFCTAKCSSRAPVTNLGDPSGISPNDIASLLNGLRPNPSEKPDSGGTVGNQTSTSQSPPKLDSTTVKL
ncbi:uncharacterized protein [Venturia canescens]|uniref:uncharacterized protein n=1 Tax=Venturia canescens TaxID=32260 RepID=UPI001C9CA587|nr:uncharacterized protein LOC122406368 [Venturia canescens]